MRWSPRGLVIIGAATASAAASCPLGSRTAAGVLSVEQRWVAALERRDGAALDCILDPTFLDTNWRGELVPKAEFMRRLPTRPESTLKLSDVRVTLIGNVAIARGVNTQSDAAQATASVRFVDVFVYHSGRWRAVSAQESLIRPTSPTE
jgi:hypothetical protein